jgi:hypothetical protein
VVVTRFGSLLRSTLCLLAAGAVALGCVVSPQPSPPEAQLSGSLIGLAPAESLVAKVIAFEGGPGAVKPPRGEVLVTNLDSADAPSRADVQPDGSFLIGVPGVVGQRFRFQVKDGDTRSQPFDLALDATGTTADAIAVQPACLTVDPPRWAALDGAGAERALTLHNDCTSAVSLAVPHLRRGLAGFTVFPASALTLAAGEKRALTVRAGDGAEVEDVLLLDVTAPAAAQRAVTLTVPDR